MEVEYLTKSFKKNFSKDSFLRALREIAPEMELFLENHGQYIKNFVIKLIYIQSCTFCHFTKKICLKRCSATFFCGNSLPNTTLVEDCTLDNAWYKFINILLLCYDINFIA